MMQDAANHVSGLTCLCPPAVPLPLLDWIPKARTPRPPRFCTNLLGSSRIDGACVLTLESHRFWCLNGLLVIPAMFASAPARSTTPRSSGPTDLTNCIGEHQRINRTASTIQTVEHWQAIIAACLEHHVALDGPMLVRLNTLMGEVVGLIRRLGEANLDLCVFCRNNNETFEMYTSHKVKDRTGRVTCPILRRFVCPLCSATGDRAHTIRYCPLSVQSGRLPIQAVSANSETALGSIESIISQLSGMSLRL